jgi:hypothetical protein
VILIAVAMIGFRAAVEGRLSPGAMAWRSAAALCAVLGLGLYWLGLQGPIRAMLLSTTDTAPRTGLVLLAAAASATVIGAALAWRSRAGPGLLTMLLALALLSADALRVQPEMHARLEVRNFDHIYRSNGWLAEQDIASASRRVFERRLQRRPARQPRDKELPLGSACLWCGYIDGRFMMEDISSWALSSALRVFGREEYFAYMQAPWHPVLSVPADPSRVAGSIRLPRPCLGRTWCTDAPNAADGIEQIAYGIDEIRYRVQLSQPTIMVENEIYFPGWRASVGPDAHQEEIPALEANGVFRAWLLPAGHYEMRARFRFPRISLYAGISIAAALVWLALLVRVGLRAARPRRRSAGRKNVETRPGGP